MNGDFKYYTARDRFSDIYKKRAAHRIPMRKKMLGWRIFVACVCAIVLILSVVTAVRYEMNELMYEELAVNIKESTAQDRMYMAEKIHSGHISMMNVANYLGRTSIINHSYEEEDFNEQMSPHGFDIGGVVANDGTVAYGPEIDIEEEPVIKAALEGTLKPMYLERSALDDEYILMLAVPIITPENDVVGAVYGAYSLEVMQEFFKEGVYHDRRDTFVVDREGHILVPVQDKKKSEEYAKLFTGWWTGDDLFISSKNKNEMKKLVQQLEKEDIAMAELYMPDGTEVYVSAMNFLGNSEIFVVNTVPAEFVTGNTTRILNTMTGILILLLLIMFVMYVAKEYLDSIHDKLVYELAFMDQLTGMGNKAQLRKDVMTLKKNGREREYLVASLDINRFKSINESMGFTYGTNLIKSVGQNLNDAMEEGERCYRGGNDVYYMLMKASKRKADEQRMLNIMKEMTDYYQDNYGHQLNFTCGLNPLKNKPTGLPSDDDISYSYDDADLARKSKKGHTANVVAYFDEEILQQLREEREIEDSFLPAIKNGEFVIYYQPKYKIFKGSEEVQLGGAEALVRWISPVKGFMPPGKFIPLFERDGNAVILDMHVMELVCRQIRSWLDDGYDVKPISVNVCRQTLVRGKDFINETEALLEAYNVPRKFIQLEVLENATGENEALMIELLEDMHKRGFKIAMDDFGRGHSSLGMLQKMPLDYLKLDKIFFDKWTEYPVDIIKEASLVRRTIQVAKDLGITIVAEGIEEKFQVDRLREFGCDMIQGYYFSKPLSADEYEKKLNK